jgi:Cyclic-phosphate processing Receiver domain
VNVYLDDERETPEGWVRTYWPDEVIALLKEGNVKKVSLDHDLGDDERGTGYDVLLWIEEAVATRQFTPPQMQVHSANSSARQKMEMAISTIERLAGKAG